MPTPSDLTTPCHGCGRMVDHDERERGSWFVVVDGPRVERWYCPLHRVSPEIAKRAGLEHEVTGGS